MGSRTLLYVASGFVAVAIVAAALVYAFVLKRPPGALAPAPTPVAAASPSPAAAPAPVATPSPAASPSSAAASASAPRPAAALAPAPTPTPAFDVVRVEPSGDTVVAGRAAPGAAVALTDDGRPIGDAAADADGQFVILPPPLSPGRHPLRLSAKVGAAAALVSEIYVAEVAGPAVAVKPAAPATPTAVAAKPAAATAPTVVAAKPTAPSAPTVVAAKSSAAPAVAPSPAASPAASAPSAIATPVVAAPSPAAAASVGFVVVGSVRPIDPAGLEAEGTAPAGARVRLRLNDAQLAEMTAGSDGMWRLTIQRGLTPGDYVLEADIIDALGATLARADEPFVYPQRAAAVVAAATPATPQASTPQASALQVSTLQALAPQAAASQAAASQASPPALAVAPSPPQASPAAAEPTPATSIAAVAPSPAAASAPSAPSSVAAARAVAPAQASPSPTVAAAAPTVAATPVATTAHAVVVEVTTVTVVKGDNLWDLARHFYGDGLRYADIYTANSTQIRDPNLIYVGQIFVMPQNPAPSPAK